MDAVVEVRELSEPSRRPSRRLDIIRWSDTFAWQIISQAVIASSVFSVADGKLRRTKGLMFFQGFLHEDAEEKGRKLSFLFVYC